MDKLDLSLVLTALPKIFISVGAMWLMITSGNSLSTAKQYQLQVAEYKLSVGSALNDVKKVSDTLEKVSNSSAIAPQEKAEIQKLTKESEAVLEELEADIEQETEKLIEPSKNHEDHN